MHDEIPLADLGMYPPKKLRPRSRCGIHWPTSSDHDRRTQPAYSQRRYEACWKRRLASSVAVRHDLGNTLSCVPIPDVEYPTVFCMLVKILVCLCLQLFHILPTKMYIPPDVTATVTLPNQLPPGGGTWVVPTSAGASPFDICAWGCQL